MPQEALPPKIPTNGNKNFYGGRFDWAELEISTDEMADAKVVSWAEQQLSAEHDEPLFLGVGIYRPHIPWYTPKQHFDKHPIESTTLPETIESDLDDVPTAGQQMARRDWHQWLVQNDQWKSYVRAYNASVSFADDMVGRLVTALDNGPLAGNTIVVLWSDHGYHLGQKEHWEKFALWEQTTRVPLVIVAPGVGVTGGVCTQPVSLLDIYPTLNELCDVRSPQTHALDGVSLVPLLRDPAVQTGRAVVCTHGEGNHAIRSDNWRYTRYNDESEELYDQTNDPKNFHYLADSPRHPAVKQELSAWLPKSAGNCGGKESKELNH
jgi:arylsulfatase A-like enzyme